MNKEVKNIIDDLILSHSDKHNNYLYIKNPLTNEEYFEALKELFFCDEFLRDDIISHIDNLIDNRIDFLSSEINYENGLYPYKDNVTGETLWEIQ